MKIGVCCVLLCVFFFQAEDGIRDLVRSRGLGDVYKRQIMAFLRLVMIGFTLRSWGSICPLRRVMPA